MLRRHRIVFNFLIASFAGCVTLNAGSACRAITIDIVPIGNPGNLADSRYIDGNHPGGVGSVGYSYGIGRTEVTNKQYVAFLSAVAASDPYGLYDPFMASETLGGIVRKGTPGSYTYSVKPAALAGTYIYDNKPVNYVSWGSAARFANWLDNGQPNGAEDASTTEDGAYGLNGATTAVALSAATRKPGARWWLPSEDEWYKAAYYNPSAGVYHDYPSGTDSEPNNNLPISDTGNSANFYANSHVTTGDFSYPLTDVGAYALSGSPYGTLDQGGNVGEWNEGLFMADLRGFRGGEWDEESGGLKAMNFGFDNPAFGLNGVGFRVATIPEPSTAALAVIACGMMLRWRRRCNTAIGSSLHGRASARTARRGLALFVCLIQFSPAEGANRIQTIALTNWPAPVSDGSFVYGVPGEPYINDRGDLTYAGTAFTEPNEFVGERTVNWIADGGNGQIRDAFEVGQMPGSPPGDAFGSTLGPQMLDNHGHSALWVSLYGPGLPSLPADSLYAETDSGLHYLGTEHSPMPGLPANTFPLEFTSFFHGTNGHVIVGARLEGGGISTNDHAIWRGTDSLQLVAMRGTSVPNAAATSFFYVEPPTGVNGLGDTVFSGYVTGPGITSKNDSAIWIAGANDLFAAVHEGDSAPTDPGVMFSDLGDCNCDFNDRRQIAFQATLTGPGVTSNNSTGIYVVDGSTIRKVARWGDPSPRPNTFFGGDIGDVTINASGEVAFSGVIDSPLGSDDAIWSEGLGGMHIVAKEHDQAPGMPVGTGFELLGSGASEHVINAAGQVAFIANFTGQGFGTGIWAEDRQGQLHLIAHQNALIEVAPGDFRRVQELRFYGHSGSQDGRIRDFNDLGQVAFQAYFDDGTYGVFVSNEVAVPEPSTAALLAISTVATLMVRRYIR
jgi:formylglycine-generating enzyme required for sulfatase activity